MFGKFLQNFRDTSKNVTKFLGGGNLWILQGCVYSLEEWRRSLYTYFACNIFGGQLLIKLK